MSIDYFVSVLRDKYSALSPSDRKRMIRELVAESREQAAFIRKNFLDFYSEAFPSSPKREGKRPPSRPRPKRAAKRR